ncbi:hypothetical protein [Parachitinimonas caeni]|uniref:Uncharacterized protein n=1 Tax=Parachitinimonas caeni TaxID=3031301 RepID=A0ABT7DWK5_9NEIS|nr:hypothetical protein [Parachitinimonas caeni]MDK2124438.1 hypothetical protein [Parachitinimonas caeni]
MKNVDAIQKSLNSNVIFVLVGMSGGLLTRAKYPGATNTSMGRANREMALRKVMADVRIDAGHGMKKPAKLGSAGVGMQKPDFRDKSI